MDKLKVCEECWDCNYFVVNNDTGNECQGQEEPCHEFTPKMGSK